MSWPLQLLVYHAALAKGTDVDKAAKPGEKLAGRMPAALLGAQYLRGTRNRFVGCGES